MVGTLYNAAAVALGAAVGLAFRGRLTESGRDAAFVAAGLFTLGLGIRMAAGMQQPLAVFFACFAGILLGNALGLQRALDGLARRWGSGGEEGGFLKAMVLFCAGSMTVIGCLEDGVHGEPGVLLVKGTMDGISAAFLAAAFGRGVLWAAPGVLVVQGVLTAAFAAAGGQMEAATAAEFSSVGGILLVALGLDLVGVRSFRMADLLPALVVLPIAVAAARWIEAVLAQFT
ncbi:MAG: DUF554 family protein [Flavobacteriales bacterium]|jgi:uncharacterized membrane protein YqgA involved in biofilm formation